MYIYPDLFLYILMMTFDFDKNLDSLLHKTFSILAFLSLFPHISRKNGLSEDSFEV